MDQGAMLERETELARLDALLDGLGESGGRVVLVRGEAGIGKSTLVGRFLHEAAGRALVRLGACDAFGTPQPLGPVWDVARRSPTVAVALDVGDRRAVMDALLDLVSHPTQPAVVVFEDVQWADEATLDVVRFLGRRIGRANGLLVLTYRDDEVDTDHPLREIFGELPPVNIVRIRLHPLSLSAVGALVGDAPLDPDDVLAFTGGNPLFVSEVVAAGSLAVPTSAEDAVLARMARLSPEARDVAEFISIHPGGVEWPLVNALLGPVTTEVREGMRHALLQVDDDGVRYRHEVQRSAVEATLAPDVRRKLHARVLAHLGDDAGPARLVHHARGAGNEDALATFAPLAARAAVTAGSHREAVAYFRMAGPLLDRLSASDAADVAEDWVRIARQHGYADDAAAVLPRAVALRRAVGDPTALAGVLTLGVMVLEIAGRPVEADAYAAEVVGILEALPPSRAHAVALTEWARLQLLRGADAAPAIEALDRAIAIADSTGDDRVATGAMTVKGILLHNARDPRGVALIEGAHARAARGGHRFEEADALLTPRDQGRGRA